MAHYKTPDQSKPSGFALHEIEPAFVHMLPEGAEEITPEEASTLSELNAPPPPTLPPQARINYLEDVQIRSTARMERELKLEEAEVYALTNFGFTPAQLYAAASAPNAPVAFRTYKRMKDIDNEIASLRSQLS